MIIKHGDTMLFRCENCGCTFLCSNKEVDDCGFFYRVNCPDCGEEVKLARKLNGEEKENETPLSGD